MVTEQQQLFRKKKGEGYPNHDINISAKQKSHVKKKKVILNSQNTKHIPPMCQVTRIFKSSKTWSLILFRSSRQITGLELFSLSCLLMWLPDVFPSTWTCFQGIKIYKNDPIIFTSQIATKERYNLEDCSSNNSCGPYICNASLKIATHFFSGWHSVGKYPKKYA